MPVFAHYMSWITNCCSFSPLTVVSFVNMHLAKTTFPLLNPCFVFAGFKNFMNIAHKHFDDDDHKFLTRLVAETMHKPLDRTE